MSDEGLPCFLLSYGGRDHRLAYTEDNVRNSLKGVYHRRPWGLEGAKVLTLPGYEDVTGRFIIGTNHEASPF
ncbi:hypothetical protein ABZ791_10570 [Streptomyces huasconensis]|uniref:Uncharacterized protein n=1 Tax=Streptomyces huasconensis TaxID=1854574 RepID=A0ABV3M710_9ACTN